MPDEREVRIATNESAFRAINERLGRDLEALVEGDELLPFVCECGLRSCAEPVRLTFAEHARIHSEPIFFAVLPGHEIEDVEDVVERHDRYLVIRKHPETWPVVERD